MRRPILKDPIERLLYLSLVVLILAAGLGIIIITIELHTLNVLGKNIQTQATTVERHTDCVALLLTQPDRASLRITNLENCRIGQ